MARIIFYQKPGCRTNTRQRAMLLAAGHLVEARDLLAEPWTAERLRAFFGALPVAEWFNRAAPRVKNGEVLPTALTAEAALALMVADPLLIRRPLLEIDGHCRAGFDIARLAGTEIADAREDCAHPQSGADCGAASLPPPG
ncbi:ArsC/Spx/MgsR family protein [Sphingomonas azotifigens]|uniref:ArsC/Spx/MgsR family protein n=1 Tax=Sphingomonas azotifigens TaxID=330920 RepID=UPI000A07BBFF|nr:ArsC/Spx/MgsR family protein [Sphingomonas azotifigens]